MRAADALKNHPSGRGEKEMLLLSPWRRHEILPSGAPSEGRVCPRRTVEGRSNVYLPPEISLCFFKELFR